MDVRRVVAAPRTWDFLIHRARIIWAEIGDRRRRRSQVATRQRQNKINPHNVSNF
jgi:hypothetical protein